MMNAKRCYAVVRVDHFLDDVATLENRVTVKEVVMSEQKANQEVERLMKLNRTKGSVYFCCSTRLIAN